MPKWIKTIYSIGDDIPRWALIISNGVVPSFMWVAFVSGQMVTVGNGIFDIGTGLSCTLTITGLSHHLIQTFRIEKLQNHIDKPIAIIHQQRSVQWRFRSLKYRTPWIVVFEQYSMTNFFATSNWMEISESIWFSVDI